MANSIPKRNEVQKENTWATEDIFASDAAWEAAYAEAKQCPAKLAAFRGKIAKDGRALLAFLQANDEIGIQTAALYRYASLKSDEDTTVSKYTEMVGRAYSLYVEIGAAVSFAVPEILTIDQANKEKFIHIITFRRILS